MVQLVAPGLEVFLRLQRRVLIYASRGRVAPRYATAGLRGDGLVSPDSCSQPPPQGYAHRALGVPACPPQPTGLWGYQRVPLSPQGSGGTSVSPSAPRALGVPACPPQSPGPRPAGQGPGGLEQSGRDQGRLALINPSAAAPRLGYR
ncbi:unnamed protein product [Boreogadus saida]